MTRVMPSHPADETLLRLVDDDLPAPEAQSLQAHLTACGDCRERLDVMRESSVQYQRFHETIVKLGVPPPPLQWAELNFEARPVDRPIPIASPRRRFQTRQWLAAAAAVAVAFLLLWRFEHAPGVKAAELLQKASIAERKRPESHRRIRIQTRNHKWDRAAHLITTDSTGLTPDALDMVKTKLMFEAAGYSWDDPLSVQSFERWRQKLPEKHDDVTTLPAAGEPQAFVIRTVTETGPLSSAALTLRTDDLSAVACTLRFGVDDTVDITELPDENAGPKRVESSTGAAPAASTLPEDVGPAEELQVVAALHRISADLGEPIGVKVDGSRVLVSVGDLDPRRREQVRAAVAGIRGAELQVGEVSGQETRAELPIARSSPQQGSSNSLVTELEATSAGGVSASSLNDQFTDTTERIIERVYALRTLARRFPPQSVQQLTAPDRKLLNGIVQDHTTELATASVTIRRLLAPILPEAATIPSNVTPAGTDWQDAAIALLTRARQIDQAMNGASDGQTDATARKATLARSLSEMDALIAAIRHAVRP